MLAVILLGRHVCESSDQRSGLSLRSLEHASDPEIDDLHRAVFVHHDVAGLDIAVNDASFMGVVECAARLRGVKEFQRDWNWHALGDHLLKIFPLDQFHGDVGHASFIAHIKDGDDIRVLQAAGGLRFAIKVLKQILVV
ncbi:MAG TPA: hypothetical protein VN902_05315 [Candidatus Acidoferrales bacterium]|nr:hypothetical protein [Candidatus Acidoferrales bacterium]